MSESQPDESASGPQLPIDLTVRAALDALGEPYQVLPCDPALADTAAFCAHYGVPPEMAGNTILVASKKTPKRYAVCILLATSRLDVNHRVRDLLGAGRLSFATEQETREVTSMWVGGVTPFGLPERLPIFIDQRVMECETVVLGGGSRSWKVRLAPQVLLRLPQVSVIQGLALPPTA